MSEADEAAEDLIAEARAAYTLEVNADGSCIVKLADPVMWQGEPISRLTIPRITGKHMRHASWAMTGGSTLGDAVTFAAAIVQPIGVIDELPGGVASLIAVEVALLLGKSRRPTGAGRSPT